MKKYLMLISLLLVGLTMARPPDEWTYFKYVTADCKDSTLDNLWNDLSGYYGDCISAGTYSQMDDVLSQMGEPPDSGVLGQLYDTAYAAGECGGDRACIARYRQQFMSQLSSFNSLFARSHQILMAAGRDVKANHCGSPGEFGGYISAYWRNIANCYYTRP